MFAQRTQAFIDHHHLLRHDATCLVGLSGGADSVALLLVLSELGYEVHAAHCNFTLRGDESDRDEAFCVELCQRLHIPLHIARFDTATYAELHHVSIEMAARDLRYNYFGQLLQAGVATHVAIAHHRDDKVETFFINLLRGTGIDGLTALRPLNGHVVRPLLWASRAQITAFLSAKEQPFITDSTNLEPIVQRNKIRLGLLPELRKISVDANERISHTISHLDEEREVMLQAVQTFICAAVKPREVYHWCVAHHPEVPTGEAAKGLFSISISQLLASPSPHYFLFTVLKRLGFRRAVTDDIVTKVSLLSVADYDKSTTFSGLSWSNGAHLSAYIHCGKIVFSTPYDDKQAVNKRIPEDGIYRIDDHQRLAVRTKPINAFAKLPNKYVVSVDAAKVMFPLTLRNATAGDRFKPLGMNGHKLVSDYLAERKVPFPKRFSQLLLTDASDNVVWLVGHRISDDFKTSPTTVSMLSLSLVNEDYDKSHGKLST